MTDPLMVSKQLVVLIPQFVDVVPQMGKLRVLGLKNDVLKLSQSREVYFLFPFKMRIAHRGQTFGCTH